MSDTIERDEVERRLGDALRGKAAQVVVDRAEFDPQRTPVSDTVVALAPRRSRRKLVAFVVTVAVAASAAGVVLVNRPHSRATGIATQLDADNPIPAPILAPTWVPDGEQLWALTPGPRSLSHPPFDASEISVQLFGTMADSTAMKTGLLLWLEHSASGVTLEGTAVTVRGHPGVFRPAIDGGEASTVIEWFESGADIQVNVRGASVAEAVAAIDALRPRDPNNLLKGFDAAADPGQYPLIGEKPMSVQSAIEVEFEYGTVAPSGDAKPDYTVISELNDATDATYLRTLNGGHLTADGSAAVQVDGDSVQVAWPDGRQVAVVANDPHPDVAVLEHIGTSAGLLDEAAASAMSDAASARVAALPALGTAHLASGDLELHGTATPSAVCLQIPGAAVACSDPYYPGFVKQFEGGAVLAQGSVVIGGQWYAFAGAPSKPSFDAMPPSGPPSGPALPVENAQIGDTYVALIAVPDGVEQVNGSVSKPDGTGSQGLIFIRPIVPAQ